ncbi:hypothetical protein ACO1O0_007126 [Amphichorda felina]
MIFGAQARSNKATILLAGTVIFLFIFVGLVYNHLDYWHSSSSNKSPAPQTGNSGSSSSGSSGSDSSKSPSTFTNDDLRATFLETVYKPSVKVDAKKFQLYGAFDFELPGKPSFKKSLGENLCIIDLDNRPFNESGGIFGPDLMSWDRAAQVHGLSTGVLNHWVYAKIHGYKYYYVEIDEFKDRRNSWKKPPVITEILKKHDACVYLDSDAIFHHLDLPFEWLMNYWDIHPDKSTLSLALDPVAKVNSDKFGKVYANTGFIIAQNNKKTFEILRAWEKCPDDDSIHPECKEYRDSQGGSGHPTDQGGFGNFIRYDYAEDIQELPCTEANGFLESKSGCSGIFIKHLWTGKRNWIKVAVGEQLPGKYLELFHEQFLAERDQFYITEKQLMSGKIGADSDGAELETE